MTLDKCDKCGVSFDDGPIPDDIRHLYQSDRWNRAIGIYDLGQDRTVAYKCPDCDEIQGENHEKTSKLVNQKH